MVNILLSVLKVIGILLLAMILLFLFLILITLFGPISYRAEGEYRDKKALSAGVNWLGVVLRCKGSYSDEQGLLWGIRLFGILIASNDEEFIQKKEEKKRKKAAKAALKQEDTAIEETFEGNALTDGSSVEEDSAPEEVNDPIPDEIGDSTPQTEEVQEALPAATPQKKKNSIFNTVKEKITSITTKIKNIILKIKGVPKKIKNLIAAIREKIDRLMEIKEFFLGERNREGFLHVINNLKKMMLHILPKKLQGRIEFGVEDPYTMGQILTVLGIFYPVYQDKFTVIPDFEQPRFAGEFSLRGRIIPGYLLFRLLSILCNREVRRIIKEGRTLIGGNKS